MAATLGVSSLLTNGGLPELAGCVSQSLNQTGSSESDCCRCRLSAVGRNALIVEMNESDVVMTRAAVICLTLWLLSSTAFAQDGDYWDYQESKSAIDGHTAYGATKGLKYTTHDGRSGVAIIIMECDSNVLRVAIIASDVFKMGRSHVIFRAGQTPPIETTMLAEKITDSSGTAFSTDSASVFDKLKLQLPKGDILRISIDNDVMIELETGDSQAVTKVAAKCGH
jgi:hypothetical protein